MSTVELIAVEVEPAANTAPRDGARATAARGFLIQLVAREVALLDRGASWLRAAGRLETLSDACERLASHSEVLREQLIVLEHHLVARWNQLDRRGRLDVAALLDQPSPPGSPFAELVELHERHVSGPTPWLELAVLRPIEQMLAAMVPLSIDLAGFAHARESDCDELQESARLFGARELRA
ncbi:MAG TPA: hypothetical protein VK034_17225, partial [Enhygromyxa sp.]|nr:hypothetical protein [Enhygromyxa sp.]